MSGIEGNTPRTQRRWRDALSPRGTLGLSPYLRQGAVFALIAVASGMGSFAFLPVALIIVFAYYLLGVASVKRLRDMERGWWWLFILALPFVGPLLISFALVGDTAGEPRPPSLFRFPLAAVAVFWIQAFFFLAVVMAGLAGEGYEFMVLIP